MGYVTCSCGSRRWSRCAPGTGAQVLVQVRAGDSSGRGQHHSAAEKHIYERYENENKLPVLEAELYKTAIDGLDKCICSSPNKRETGSEATSVAPRCGTSPCGGFVVVCSFATQPVRGVCSNVRHQRSEGQFT